jgi:hypothetical protein
VHEVEPRTSVRTSPLPKRAPGHTKTCSRFNLCQPESVLPSRHTKACSRFNICLLQSVLPGTKACSRSHQNVLSFQPLPTSKRAPGHTKACSRSNLCLPPSVRPGYKACSRAHQSVLPLICAYLKASVTGNSNKELCKEPICHWKC